ncbi:recombinase family protein [Anaerotignum sp. MB30-C6]|uniref:recombinase family protein n=1 Tax=Anaerotignum sp. MB30-C6 TaxID=3070814 RepID=UPI0027DBDB22|nr:recombinase family protein [Anaerotignum sp. MB30-C6]WMI81566.1 recombinase family protein [Anaerotignum sp. MB30-C6]
MTLAAAYIRVSTDDQTDYSPSAQLEDILSFAEKNGYYIPKEFIFEDEGISGRSADKRPGFQEMIRQARKKQNKIEYIIVHKYDRFARNKEDAVLYKALLKKDGVKVLSVKEPIPQDDKFAVIYESMLEAMAEYYSLNLAEEVKKTMVKKAMMGEYQSTPPFGYCMKNKLLTPIPEEATMIRFIYEAYASGKESMFSLSRQMNQMGFRTHRGGVFENRTIQYILNNPVYKGYSRWTPTGRTRRNFNNPDSVIAKGNWEPLVSQELWEAAANRINREKRTHYSHKRPETEGKHWISSMIKCSACQRSLVIAGRHKTSDAFYLQCGGYNHGQCHVSHSLSSNRLFPALFDTLRNIALGKEDTVKYHIRRFSLDTDETESIELMISKTKQRIAKAKEAYLAGVDTLDEYRQTKIAVDEELKTLSEKLNTAKQKQFKPFDYDLFSNKVLNVLTILQNETASMESKRASFKSIVEKVIYDKPNGSLELFLIGD